MESITRCGPPLRLIFWGGILALFDFTYSSQTHGRGFRFDFLNDFVGMVMISIGVWRIARLQLDGRIHPGLSLAFGVSCVSTVAALVNHFIFPKSGGYIAAETLLAMAELAAILAFCHVLRSYAHRAGLSAAAASWRFSFRLFMAIYAIPLGLMHLLTLLSPVLEFEFNIDLGPAILLLLPVFLWPLIHFFMSTSRMIKAVAPPGPEERIPENA